MEKLFKWLMVLFIPLISLTLTSCGGDDDDEPEVPGSSSNTITNYGVVKSTGVKTISLFASQHDGETVLLIPGFAPIRLETEYNIYTHHNIAAHLYSDDLGNDFAKWEPGNPLPVKFDERSYNDSFLVRTKEKNSNQYVYAYVERLRYLEESTGAIGGNVIGGVYKYTSPIDPTIFTGFPKNQ